MSSITTKEIFASLPVLSLGVAIPEFVYYGSKSLATVGKLTFAKMQETHQSRKGNAIKTFIAQTDLTGYKKELSGRLYNFTKAKLAIIPGFRYYLAKKEEKLGNLLFEAAATNNLQIKTDKYKEAAALGSSQANFQLFLISNDCQFLIKAANQGHSGAQRKLAVEYSKYVSPNNSNLLYPDIIKWFTSSALQKNPDALNSLGVAYCLGKYGLKKSPELSAYLIERAFIEDGGNDPIIKANHALSLIEGAGIKQDVVVGLRLLKEVAATGKDDGMSNYKLGKYHEKGEFGCPVDVAKAKEYYQRAADLRNYNKAIEGLNRISPPERREPDSRSIFDKADSKRKDKADSKRN